MSALLKTHTSVALQQVARAPQLAPRQVRIQVARVGVCRTDLHVAWGRLPCVPPRILGHELSGVIREVGGCVTDLQPSMAVTVEPLLACETCRACREGLSCLAPKMLGLDLDGAFAQELVVPAHAVHRVPDTMSFERAAYVEPVAASLAVLHSGISAAQRGLILGSGRIAELTRRVLAWHGFTADVAETTQLDDGARAFDWVIDTAGTSASLHQAMCTLRHGGTLVLKSRPASPLRFDVSLAVQRELTLRAVRYAPFQDAIALLNEPTFSVEELFGEIHPLSAFEHVFARAEQGESSKQFFAPNAELG